MSMAFEPPLSNSILDRFEKRLPDSDGMDIIGLAPLLGDIKNPFRVSIASMAADHRKGGCCHPAHPSVDAGEIRNVRSRQKGPPGPNIRRSLPASQSCIRQAVWHSALCTFHPIVSLLKMASLETAQNDFVNDISV
jgi:hypothetical protein